MGLLGDLFDHIGNPPGHNKSYDWCRFRRDSRCYHPKDLDSVGTAEAGYAVWQIVDRGWCPRTAWEEQEKCPVGQPGPNVPNIGQVEVTRPWNEGGQHQTG